MADKIQVLQSLEDVYGFDDSLIATQEHRYRDVVDKFERLYNRKPDFFVRAPGRVNIIGEHVDYSGYPVLPMALAQDTIVAVARTSDGGIQIHNTQSSMFDSRTFDVDPSQSVDNNKHHWTNYFLCGYKGAFEGGKITGSPTHMQVVVSGCVPPGAGLSSSSSMVVASALATAHANHADYSKVELAELTCRCERYIGTAGGGMDQAISILAQPNVAKLIEFNPLTTFDVELPKGASFVIANSLAESSKALTVATRFNKRVLECRLAAVLIVMSAGHPWNAVKTLKQAQKLLGLTLADMIQSVESVLHQAPYTKAELQSIIGRELSEVVGDLQKFQLVLDANDNFFLQQRASHVYSETYRVYKFRSVCIETDISADDKLQRLGSLMDESHASCRDFYDCSSAELDELTALCKQAGALGSRLTGAGWGGCTVSLVPDSLVDSFMTQVQEYYSRPRGDYQALWIADDVDQYLFATKPSRGACVLDLSSTTLYL